MTDPVLVGYATTYGSTQEVAEAVAESLRECGVAAEVHPLREVRSLTGYRAVILGAPLIMFHWHKDALRFLARHQQAIGQLPVAIFALGPTHVPHDEKEWEDTRAQLSQELSRFVWLRPVALELFGGRFDPTLLRFPLSWLAGKAPASDLRDWAAIRAWAASLVAALG